MMESGLVDSEMVKVSSNGQTVPGTRANGKTTELTEKENSLTSMVTSTMETG